MKSILFTLLALYCTFAVAAVTHSADRVALVVGIGAYEHNVKLVNPPNDAKAIADLLTRIGFQVTLLIDVGAEDFYEGIDKFKREAAEARVGLFYFAGHGVEVEKQNYLLPADASLERQSQLRTQAISLKSVLDEMKEVRLPAKMLILDCCRNNPLKRSWMLKRGKGGGLAALGDTDIPPATMILFAAAPGQEAFDGEGVNSPFTEALVTELAIPNRNALEAFYAVSDRVVKSTGKRQEPWVKVDGAGRTFRQFRLAVGDPLEGKMTPPSTSPPIAKTEPKRPPGEKLVNQSGITLLWCPPGKFTMGDPELESAPLRPVTLTRGFWLGQHEITRNEYRKVMKTDASKHYPDPLDDSPVDMISWEDAIEFCQRLSRLEQEAGSLPKGFEYALPSEAQWEYACRAGSTTAYSFGDDLTLKQANFRHNGSGMMGMSTKVKDPDESGKGDIIVSKISKGSPAEKAGVQIDDRVVEIDDRVFDHDVAWLSYAIQKNEGDTVNFKLERAGKTLNVSVEMESYQTVMERAGIKYVGTKKTEKGHNLGRPAVVGSYPANAWGFTEMPGNVWEWCGDWYVAQSNRLTIDPVGVSKGKFRILRGGSWNNSNQLCRAGWHRNNNPRVDSMATGFRIALVPTGSLPWVAEKRSLKNQTRIVPDQYSTIQAALDDARNGDTIMVKEGIYRETITMNDWKDIEIRGENQNTTILRAEDHKKNLFTSFRVARGSISNLTFELNETSGEKEENDVHGSLIRLQVESNVTVKNCVFRGGNKMYGVFHLNGKLQITDCLFEDCYFGIATIGKGSVTTIRDSTIRRSEKSGIIFQGGANGTAQGNILEKGKESGITVIHESTSVRLSQNTCTDNDGNGISFGKASSGSAEGNQCRENGGSGIHLTETGNIELTDNVSNKNEHAGIYIGGCVSGFAKGNQCEENKQTGIWLLNSSFRIEGNDCDKNGFSGIGVNGAASKPSIISNNCRNNTEYGIGVAAASYPAEFRDNQASGNKQNPQLNRKVKYK